MDTLHLVDPSARDMAQAFAAFDPSVQPIDEYRQKLLTAFAQAGPAADPTHEEHKIPGQAGDPDIRLLIHRPSGVAGVLPAVLFLHPSGFIAGNPEMSAEANVKLAQDLGAVIVAVAYRLAPETPFPGALHDAYSALTWIFKNVGDLGVDPDRIAIMGESAGNGLAASLALMARDRSEYKICAQVLIYPMLDPRTGTSDAPTTNPTTGEFVWTERHNRFAWAALRGRSDVVAVMARDRSEYKICAQVLIYPMLDPRTGTSDAPTTNPTTGEFVWTERHNRFAWAALRGRSDVVAENLGTFGAALANDLSNLLPTFIAVGALDLFLEEDVAYALRLARAAIPTELHVYPGGIHGFDTVPGPLGSQYHDDLLASFKRILEREKNRGS